MLLHVSAIFKKTFGENVGIQPVNQKFHVELHICSRVKNSSMQGKNMSCNKTVNCMTE